MLNEAGMTSSAGRHFTCNRYESINDTTGGNKNGRGSMPVSLYKLGLYDNPVLVFFHQLTEATETRCDAVSSKRAAAAAGMNIARVAVLRWVRIALRFVIELPDALLSSCCLAVRSSMDDPFQSSRQKTKQEAHWSSFFFVSKWWPIDAISCIRCQEYRCFPEICMLCP
jgi:hypothetical protein